MAKPIRFGTGPGMVSDPVAIVEAARTIEKLGYSTLGLADHFMMPVAPLIALQAIADATTDLILTTTVLDQDFRHPAVLAKELATLDVLSGGRLEVGIGAGWMRAEYDQSGIPFDNPSVRIERLEEVVIILKGLFADESFSFSGKHFVINGLNGLPKPVQRPGPPIMIGGGGRKVLTVAARHADIIGITPKNPSGTMAIDVAEYTAGAYEQKVSWIREAAGARLADIELQLMPIIAIADEENQAMQMFDATFGRMLRSAGSGAELSQADIRESPGFVIGTVDQVCEKLLATRDRFGISYFTAGFGSTPESLLPVIEQLTGR